MSSRLPVDWAELSRMAKLWRNGRRADFPQAEYEAYCRRVGITPNVSRQKPPLCQEKSIMSTSTDIRFNLTDAIEALQSERTDAIRQINREHDRLAEQLKAAAEVVKDGIPTIASATAALVVDFANTHSPIADIRLSFGPNDWGQAPTRLVKALPPGDWRAIVLVVPRRGDGQ